MASTGDPELDARLYAAFCEVAAGFSVNLSDIAYRRTRRIAVEARAARLSDLADELDASAERMLTGEAETGR